MVVPKSMVFCLESRSAGGLAQLAGLGRHCPHVRWSQLMTWPLDSYDPAGYSGLVLMVEQVAKRTSGSARPLDG